MIFKVHYIKFTEVQLSKLYEKHMLKHAIELPYNSQIHEAKHLGGVIRITFRMNENASGFEKRTLIFLEHGYNLRSGVRYFSTSDFNFTIVELHSSSEEELEHIETL